MIDAIWDEGFKKSYRKRVQNNNQLKNKFWGKMELFLEEPFSAQLKTHKLGGKLSGLWAFSVAEDCRVVFKFIDSQHVLLIEVGKHDEVY